MKSREDAIGRGFLLVAAGYDAKVASGPEMVDGLLGEWDGTNGLQYVGPDLATVRIVIRFAGQNPSTPVEWIAGHEGFWISMIPDTEQVMVRSLGWPALWDEGVPSPPARPSFMKMQRASLVTAVLANPYSAAWWLEVTDVPAGRPVANWSRYFAFCDHGWGSDPLLIGPSAWVEEQAAKVIEEYASIEFQRAELKENSLKAAFRELGVV